MNTASCCTFAPSSSSIFASKLPDEDGRINTPFPNLFPPSFFSVPFLYNSSSVCNRAWPCHTREKYTLSIQVSSKKPQTDTSHREALHVHSTLQGMLGLHSSIPPESGE